MGDRHMFRARWHDYSEGIFFVTICTYNKKKSFGEVVGTTMKLSKLGEIVEQCITTIKVHSKDTNLLNYTVMPNHVHLLIQIEPVGTQYIASAPSIAPMNTGCLKPPRHGEACPINHHNSRLTVVIRTLKAAITRKGKEQGIISPQRQVWQSRFHEHIVKNQREYEKIFAYISENPLRWSLDVFNCE